MPSPMKRFVIKQGDVYYMTMGKMFVYDEDDIKEPKKEEKKKGVKKMQEEFKKIHDAPETWYPAVEITDPNFKPVQTKEIG